MKIYNELHLIWIVFIEGGFICKYLIIIINFDWFFLNVHIARRPYFLR